MIKNLKKIRAIQFVVESLFVARAISVIAFKAIIPSVAIFLSNNLISTFFQIVAVAGIACGFMCLISWNNLIVTNIAKDDAAITDTSCPLSCKYVISFCKENEGTLVG